MKISPTILNSSSALGLGSVSQCALGSAKGLVRGAEIPREEPPRELGRGQGTQETSNEWDGVFYYYYFLVLGIQFMVLHVLGKRSNH